VSVCVFGRAQVLQSARARRLFWVFLDHQMTSQGLERVLDVLAQPQHRDQVAIVNLDQALRLCAAEPATRRCFEAPRPDGDGGGGDDDDGDDDGDDDDDDDGGRTATQDSSTEKRQRRA
jgi:hypothetical protein